MRFTLVIVGCMIGCSSNPITSPSNDAGASRPDASRADGAIESGCSPIDAAPDATWGPVGEDWMPVPGLPVSCSVRVSPSPSTEVSAFQWVPCPSGRPGCQVLQPDWVGWISFPSFESPRLVNGSPVLMHYRTYAHSFLDPEGFVAVVSPLDGAALFALGQVFSVNETCVANGGIGDYGFAFNVVSGTGGCYSHFLETAAWASPLSLTSRSLTMIDFGVYDPSAGLDALALGAQYTWEETGLGSVGAVPLAGGPPIYPTHPTFPNVVEPHPVPDGAIIFDEGVNGYAVDLVRLDGSYTVLIAPDATHVLTAINIDRANANALTWVLCDGNQMNCVIWRSPYATTSSGVQATQVAQLHDTTGNGGHYMAVNANVALAIIDATTLQLTRLTDGLGWQINAEPGLTFGTALWADDQEVWASLIDPKITGKETSILRMTRASLGAPTMQPF